MTSIDLTKIKYYVTAVLSDGSQVSLESICENIAWEENRSELSQRLNLTLRDTAFRDSTISRQLALCTVIYLYADWGEGKKEIFRGTIWNWQHSEVNGDAITITAYDMLYSLQKSKDYRYYATGKNTEDIINDILMSWEVPIGQYVFPSIIHQKTVFKNKTIAAMLKEILEKAKDIGGVEALVRSKEGKVDVIMYGANETCYEFRQDTNLIASNDHYSMTNLITRIIILGKSDDDETRPPVEATMDGKTEYGIMQDIVNIGSGTSLEARETARQKVKEKGTPERTIKLTAPDFPAIRKGDMIKAKTDKLEGFFYVRGVSHNATNCQMQMEVDPIA